MLSLQDDNSIPRSISFGSKLFYASLTVTLLGLALKIGFALRNLDVGALIEQHMEAGITSFFDNLFGVVVRFESAFIKGISATICKNYHWSLPWILRVLFMTALLYKGFGIKLGTPNFTVFSWQRHPIAGTPNLVVPPHPAPLARSASDIAFSSLIPECQANKVMLHSLTEAKKCEDCKCSDPSGSLIYLADLDQSISQFSCAIVREPVQFCKYHAEVYLQHHRSQMCLSQNCNHMVPKTGTGFCPTHDSSQDQSSFGPTIMVPKVDFGYQKPAVAQTPKNPHSTVSNLPGGYRAHSIKTKP